MAMIDYDILQTLEHQLNDVIVKADITEFEHCLDVLDCLDRKSVV